jgi:ATP adenylyltransferase
MSEKPASNQRGVHLSGDALQAPWRQDYLEALGAKEKAAGTPKPGTGSFLRDAFLDPASDGKNLVIVRNAHGLIMLNLYPYAGGHLLVALGEARGRLLDYTPEQRAEFWKLVDVGMDLVERALEPQGVNMGINQGRASGAGVPQHLHAHLVPRWSGDINFMTTVGNVRVIPTSVEKMAERYREVAQRVVVS